MADGLKLAQMSGLFAGMAQSQSAYNPAQKVFTDYLQGSAQSAIAAEARKKAEKAAKKKKGGLGGLLGAVGAVAATPFVGPAALAYLPTAMAAGGAAESLVGGDIQGAVSNTANAVGSAYGGGGMGGGGMGLGGLLPPATSLDPRGQMGGQGMTQRNPETDPMQLLEPDGITSIKKSIANAPQPTSPRSDVWENTMGGVAQRAGVISIANKSGRELRRDLLSNPNAERALVKYLQAGGQLTPQQMRMLPASTKRVVRTYGYDVPGPFGMLSF